MKWPKIVLLTPLLLTAYQVQARNLPASVQEHPCFGAMLHKAEQFGTATDSWRRFMRSFDGYEVFRAPSEKIGYWFEIQFAPDKPLKAYEISPQDVVTIQHNSGCELEVQNKPRRLDKAKMDASFTDADLEAFANQHPEGAVVIAWSPGMPLSLQMIENARKVSGMLNIPVKFVRDPKVPEAVARRFAEEHQLGEVLEPLESVELIYQGMTTHYPATILLQDGKVASPMYPGLGGVKQLLNFIEQNMTGETQSKAQIVAQNSPKIEKNGGITVPALLGSSSANIEKPKPQPNLALTLIALACALALYFTVKKLRVKK